MLYMVIEQLKDAPAIYRRLREKGRMMPNGLNYISSWIDTELKVCYQLMETEDPALFPRWTENWDDLMEFKSCRYGPRPRPQRFLSNPGKVKKVKRVTRLEKRSWGFNDLTI